MRYKVSVIIPLYNVSQYLERCVDSLMQQTLDSIEYIFVLDCPTDDTEAVLEKSLAKYPKRRADVKILKHQVNMGISSTRADGMAVATGDFIIQMDGDDTADVTMYEKLYTLATGTGAEIAICDIMFVYGDRKERWHHKLALDGSHEDLVRSYLADYWNSTCDKLVARSLFERCGVVFPKGISMGEDFFLTLGLVCCSDKVAHLDEALYYYNRQNDCSATHTFNRDKCCQERWAIQYYIDKFKADGVYDCYKRELNWRLLKNKANMVLTNHFDEFKSSYPESNRYILSLPNQFCSLKVKFMMVLTWLGLSRIVRWDNRRHGRY